MIDSDVLPVCAGQQARDWDRARHPAWRAPDDKAGHLHPARAVHEHPDVAGGLGRQDPHARHTQAAAAVDWQAGQALSRLLTLNNCDLSMNILMWPEEWGCECFMPASSSRSDVNWQAGGARSLAVMQALSFIDHVAWSLGCGLFNPEVPVSQHRKRSGFMMLKSKVTVARWDLAVPDLCGCEIDGLENAGVQPVHASSQHQAPGAVVRRWGTARLLPLRLTGGAALKTLHHAEQLMM